MHIFHHGISLLKFMLSALLVAGISSSIHAQAELLPEKIYRVAIDQEFAPYEFVDSYGHAQGFTPSILRIIEKNTPVKFEFISMTWPNAVQALDTGQVDIISMIENPERVKKYLLSIPISQISQAIFRNSASHDIFNLASLSGHIVGLQKNDIFLAQLKDSMDFKKHLVDSKLDGLLHLELGKIDAFICSQQACIRAIKEYDFKNIQIAQSHLFPQNYAFATRRDNWLLIALLDRQLLKLRNNGQLKELDDQWLRGSLPKMGWFNQNRKTLYVATGLMLIILIAILFWNRSLLKLVDASTKSLKEKNQLFDSIIENSPNIIFLKRIPEMRYVLFNRAGENLLGRGRENILGRNDYDLFPKGLADFFTQKDLEVMDKNHIVDIPQHPVDTHRGVRILHTRKLTIRDKSGHPKYLLGISEDISDSEMAKKRIAYSESVFRGLFENMNSSVAVYEAVNGCDDFIVKDFNPAAEFLERTTRHNIVNKRMSACFPESKKSGLLAVLIRVWKTGTSERCQINSYRDSHISCWYDYQIYRLPSGEVVTVYEDITANKLAEEEIKNLAFYDTLTHLPNRRFLMDRLQLALANSELSGQHAALLFIDIDNFKQINDTLGHDMGDFLLQQAAQRLRTCIRIGDTVARMGGDEFVVILKNLHSQITPAEKLARGVGEKILSTLNQAYQLHIHKYASSASIGITLFNNQCALDVVFRQADIAMYQAKNAGRNTLRFFDKKMQDAINARAILQDELRKAVAEQQFQLYYQVQMDSSQHPVGAEALIRWLHPEHGMMSPDKFIPLAEEIGLIESIGLWVIETACLQLKAWQKEELTRELILAVNVSAKQIHMPDFVHQLQISLNRHVINPRLLKLELTESLLLNNIENTISTMNTLKEIGIQFSLDDFGTGYSSLQYLKRLPLHQLKIDQSFVRDIVTENSDKAIVRTIIAMAHSLGLNVIAEGVETEAQRITLTNKGCSHYQGYLFSKPVPIKQFEALLDHCQHATNQREGTDIIAA